MSTSPNKGLATIIINCRNAEKFLKETLDCATHQSYKNLEILVVDNMSSDSTFDIVKHYMSNDYRIKVISTDGPISLGASRNLGLENSNGEIVFFLDSDDLMLKTYVETHMNTFNLHPELTLGFGKTMLIGEEFLNTNLVDFIDKNESLFYRDNSLFKRILWNNTITFSSVSLRMSDILSSIKFDPTLTHAEDYDFLLRILQNKKSFRASYVFYRIHIHQQSNNVGRLYFQEVLYILEQYNKHFTAKMHKLRLIGDYLYEYGNELPHVKYFGRVTLIRKILSVILSYIFKIKWKVVSVKRVGKTPAF
jgi:glycosyltransferase involved in cell wall biosynthesis